MNASPEQKPANWKGFALLMVGFFITVYAGSIVGLVAHPWPTDMRIAFSALFMFAWMFMLGATRAFPIGRRKKGDTPLTAVFYISLAMAAVAAGTQILLAFTRH